MDKLRVRVYDVHFGDAILVTIPDRDLQNEVVFRNILIDFGNVASGPNNAGDDALFEPVIENIREVLGDRPLDLYVMTHEHMDHVQGLLYCSEKLQKTLKVDYAWLTASSAPDYYTNGKHPDSKKKRDAARKAYFDIKRYIKAAAAGVSAAASEAVESMLLNNDYQKTDTCVAFLRGLTPNTFYVHREFPLSTEHHSFREAQFNIWAPEEDTSDYYGRLQPMALGVAPTRTKDTTPALLTSIPPHGVDAGAFYDLIEHRRHGYGDNLLAIDRAANNTSVVFSITWRGWKLLFTGDAEQASWKTMNKKTQLTPVHFLKVAHHGSANGTPPEELLNKILPVEPVDNRQRYAAISTWEATYSNVPDEDTVRRLKERCVVKSSTADLSQNEFFVDFEFEA